MKKYFLLTLLLTMAGTLAAYELGIGKPAPEFELSDQTGQLHSLEDYRDQWVVLYFYPKDDTPGCTTEACEFRDNIFAFKEINAQILGVSLDDVDSHRKFAENYDLPFPLLADVEGKTATAYGVKTKMFGMTVAKRETFLIDPKGNLAKHYVKVKPDIHSKQVLADLRELGATSSASREVKISAAERKD
ncbi:MAG: peroxiredoxin [Gammaproteobacteria bacterium]|nr:peroxiredoxin [Gammaproteobacteria bacterium]